MATAAEILKARLAKYAKPVSSSTSVAEVNPVVHGTDVRPVLAATDASPSVAVTSSLSVTTDLQPTALVVVERPNETVVDSGTASGTGPTNLDVTLPHHVDFLQRLSDLETALLARDPMMKMHLLEIHKSLHQYEEIVSLLTVEEIAKIMSAQQAHVAVVLRAEVVKSSKTAAAKKTAQLGLNDI